jgi:drug/metabolite transporter (DMT)-like permease
MTNSVESLNQSPIQSLDKKSIAAPFIPLLLGIMAIGFAPIFIKWSEAEISPGAITFNRLWISSLVFGIWNGISLIRRRWSINSLSINLPSINSPSISPQPYNLQVLGLLLIIGIAFSGKHLLWAWSLTQTSVANSIAIIYALVPPLSALGGWIFFQRRVETQFLMGMTIAIGGAIAIGVNDFSNSSHQIQGDLLALLTAVLSPFYLLTMEKLLTQFETKTLIFWCSTIGALLTLPILIVVGERLFPLSWQGWCSVIALALVCQVMGQGLIAYSLNFLSSGMVAVTMLLDPVLSALLAWAILSEKITILNGVSCCIVLFGIYLTIISKSASKSNPVS